MEPTESKYWALSKALGELLPGVSPERKLLERISYSFHCAFEGLRAARSCLLLAHSAADASTRFTPAAALNYTPQQLNDLANGQIPHCGEKFALQEPPGELASVVSLEGWDSRILLIRLRNPVLDITAFVAVFEHAPEQPAFGEQELQWGQFYAVAAAQAIGREFHLSDYPMSEPFSVPEVTGAPKLVGNSPWAQNLRRELHQIYIPACGARDPDPILILGEKGTGKDLIARYIAGHSLFRKKPFIAVNCAEITDELASSRFFGHRKGSYTGASADEPGFFRAAQGGVLFLDEIAELSLRAQATLLRVLENRTIVPLGETKEIRVDVQVILATNHDLDTAVAQKILRADLCDRFRIQAIHLSPLRMRPTDIPPLIAHFVAHHEQRMNKKTLGLDPDTLRSMVGYNWPGNVRELSRVCSLLVAHTAENTSVNISVLARHLPEIVKAERNPRAGALQLGNIPMREALHIFQREVIASRLHHFSWDAHATRQSLGMPKTTFHRHLRKLNLAQKAEASNLPLTLSRPSSESLLRKTS